MGHHHHHEKHRAAHDEVYSHPKHESHWTHEIVAGAAAFAAMKEIFAALAAAEADKLFETKGLDFIDREKAKHAAKKHADEIYEHDFA
ncbi:hypothetical protein BGZ80_011059 [Entomortierella chlamydospora]|uniref:Uncharacterized protein n=1 Tax=Entomortierella chlamydospora TaxID=101097 RepID=A0A9P6MTZ0_9FUNG|nr:hypothetical protein BGZ80_011059 [Entomortierella chlamydospora]